MEDTKNEEVKVTNEELEAKLTKRNEQYVYSLKKALQAANLSEERQEQILADTLGPLVDGQKHGMTARQLFGTVTEYTNQLLSAPSKVASEGKDWMYVIDGGLLMVAMMSIVTAATGFMKNSQGAELGLAALVAIFFIGGFGMMLITKNMPVKGKKGSTVRYLLVTIGVILGLALIMGLVLAVIPPAINPVLSPPVYAVIGIAAIAAKFYLKRRWNLQNTFM